MKTVLGELERLKIKQEVEMNNYEKNSIEKKISLWVQSNAPTDWKKCCVYIELIIINNDYESDESVVWFDSNNQVIDYLVEGSIGIQMTDLFYELNKVSFMTDNRSWTTCKMKVTSDGKYNFDFGYDIPPRLMGSAEDLMYDPDYKEF